MHLLDILQILERFRYRTAKKSQEKDKAPSHNVPNDKEKGKVRQASKRNYSPHWQYAFDSRPAAPEKKNGGTFFSPVVSRSPHGVL